MTKKELKPVIGNFLKGMMEDWFPDLPLVKGIGLSLVDANINKFDSIIDMFADENGNIDVNNLRNNIPSTEIRINLKELSPILPNRTLLVTKGDMDRLFNKLMKE
jgi:hypothetical protein